MTLVGLSQAHYAAPAQFVDDVEFWFKPGQGSRVEYRSASRIGESDGDANRKRIRALRCAPDAATGCSRGGGSRGLDEMGSDSTNDSMLRHKKT